MKRSLKDYPCDWEKYLNIDLITKGSDPPLVEYIIDAWKSLGIVRQIEFTKFEYTEKESEIDYNKYVFKREKRRKKKDRFDVKLVDDTRCGKLTVHMNITMLETDPTTGETSYQVYPVKKAMLIPLQDEDGLYFINGHKYYLIYQMVEKST